MPEPQFRKPIFGFLWTNSSEISTNQSRFLRVGRRGIIRLGILVTSTLVLLSVATISTGYLLTSNAIIESFLIGAMVATSSVLVLRGWILGTYVNDTGIKIVRTLSTRVVPWTDVEDVHKTLAAWRLLSIPIGLRSHHVVLRTKQNELIPTHVYKGSIDGLFTDDSVDILQSLITRWWRAE